MAIENNHYTCDNQEITLVDINDYESAEESVYAPHYHSYHLIALVTEGHGILDVAGEKHHFKKNDLMLIPQNTIHTLLDHEHLFSHNVIFQEKMLQSLPLPVQQVIEYNLLIGKGFRIFSLDSQEFEGMELLYKALEYENDRCRDSRFHQEVLDSLFCSFIATSIRPSSKETKFDSKEDELLLHLIDLIDQHFRSRMRVADYAQLLGMSVKTLDRRITRIAGVSPQKMISQKKASEAMNMLRTSPLSIKEIAFQLGFCDSAHFTNFFKEYTGVTPSRFKKIHSCYPSSDLMAAEF